MTKITSPVQKPTNGKAASSDVKKIADTANTILSNPSVEEKKIVVPVALLSEPRKEMTLQEKIMKIENLQLVVGKREKLVATRSELDRFQISSNDFNCTMRLNDSDGNVFSTNFTPGIKKVIEFLKGSFDASIAEVEKKINF